MVRTCLEELCNLGISLLKLPESFSQAIFRSILAGSQRLLATGHIYPDTLCNKDDERMGLPEE